MPVEYRVRKADASEVTEVPTGARLVKACTPCQSRKIKCDGGVPKCGSCSRSRRSDCNVIDCVLWTQKHVSNLEERIQWLHALVSRTYEDGDLIAGVKTGTTLQPKPQKDYVVEPSVEEVGLLSLRAHGAHIGSMSGVTLTRLVCTAIRLEGEELANDMSDTYPPPVHHTRASYPSRPLAITYVTRYLTRIHRWYPFLDLGALTSSLTAVYESHTPLNDAARFTLLMVFALCAGDPLDPYTPQEYFRSALGFLNPIIAQSSFESLKAMLLLCLYSLRSWEKDTINSWQVIGHATRLAIELDLHRHRNGLGEVENEARRKLWWSIYGVERSVACGVCRVLAIRHDAVDQYTPRDTHAFLSPALQSFLGTELSMLDLRPAIHLLEQRRLLGEILECVYATRPRDRPTISLAETSARVFEIQSRLVAWAQEVQTFSKAETVERDGLQLAFHQATALLHRPSPSFPCPAPDVLDISMGAATGAIRISASALRNDMMDEIMPGWEGIHTVFMSGLTLLYGSWAAPGCPNSIPASYDDHPDPDLDSALNVLDTLTRQHRLPQHYSNLYRKVALVFKVIRRKTFGGGDIRSFITDSLSLAAQSSGLGSGLEGLELDQEAVDSISGLLEGLQEPLDRDLPI